MGGLINARFQKEPNNGIAVNLQDQTSAAIGHWFHIDKTTVTLASGVAEEDQQVTLQAGHGAVVGDGIIIKEGTEYYEGIIVGVTVNVIDLDTPLDGTFTTGASVLLVNYDLAVDGSGTAIVARVTPHAGVKWDVTRIYVAIADATAMDDGTFGGMGALTKGCVLRGKYNGNYVNVINIKTNQDLGMACNVQEYHAKAPGGEYGFRCMVQIAGQSAIGVAIRLDGDMDQELQLLIQDDLTDLSSFRVRIQGHVVV